MSLVIEPLTTAMRVPLAGRIWLHAGICTPPAASGLVLLAQGSGGSHQNDLNSRVAFALDSQGMATMVADLLTDEEEKRSGALPRDTGLLTHRLVQMIDWAHADRLLGSLPIGLFGAGAGAAAIAEAAALRSDVVRAVVCKGDRADLAARVARVKVPTLFLAGDYATHEALEAVATAAGMWFRRHLTRRQQRDETTARAFRSARCSE